MIIIYVIVSIGTTLLVGQEVIIEKREVAIALAGREAFGFFGLLLASIGALFSTGSAINSTIFSSARLAKKVADYNELPKTIKHNNKHRIPNRAVIIIGSISALLSSIGTLNQLVEGASFIFLITFMMVNIIALIKIKKHRLISLFGIIGSMAAALSLLRKFILHEQTVLIFLLIVILFATFGRKIIIKQEKVHL